MYVLYVLGAGVAVACSESRTTGHKQTAVYCVYKDDREFVECHGIRVRVNHTKHSQPLMRKSGAGSVRQSDGRLRIAYQ